KHSEEDRGAQGLAHFRAGAFAEHQRKNTEDESKRSHQDRTETQTSSFDRRGEAIFFIAILDLLGELDNEDGVLTGESDQHDKADLGKDVVLHRAQPNAADRTEQ